MSFPRRLAPFAGLVTWIAAVLLPVAAAANPLEEEIGRSEVRIRSAPYPLPTGRTVAECRLVERLERLGYRRVHQRPQSPGEFFWGHEVFRLYRRAFRWGGDDHPAALLDLELRRRDGMILRPLPAEVEGASPPDEALRLEPELLAESLAGDRARRRRVHLDELPDHVWQAVLAAEDARFFDHAGVDARSLVRALWANLRAGRITQGGSTITQQLVKNRDLSPRRTLGRKASEALRALALEAEHDKRQILEAYLNQLYLGHAEGLAIHGLGTAAEVFFQKSAAELDLAEAALVAAIIQGPNRLSPERHRSRARERRDWVLTRLEELGWATAGEVEEARETPIALRPGKPEAPIGPHFLAWVADLARAELPGRIAEGRGVVAETTLDPELQRWAEEAVGGWIAELRSRYRSLRSAPVSAALVAVDAPTGSVLAHVGGDPATGRGGFDRARSARRQPGSAVKPLLLLEAFETCGDRDPLYPASRVADEPLRLDLPSGAWEPVNPDGTFRGVVDVREALRRSLNVPFVRIARWCGFKPTAARLRRSGLEMPEKPPPSFALGAVEATPLELARAYTVFAAGGRAVEPRPVERFERPQGRKLERFKARGRRVASEESAYLVRDLMVSAASEGTARNAELPGVEVAAKTGSTSDLRDAWLAGEADGLVAVVWVGRDDSKPLGLTGSAAAAPLWKRFMERAVHTRTPREVPRPDAIVTRFFDPRTGLLVRQGHRRARPEIFRRGALPRRARFWRADPAMPVVR